MDREIEQEAYRMTKEHVTLNDMLDYYVSFAHGMIRALEEITNDLDNH